MSSFHHKILEERTLDGKYRAIPEDCLSVEMLFLNIRTSQRPRKEIINEYFRPVFFCYRNPSSSDLFCMDLMVTAIRQDILKSKLELITTAPEISEIIESERRGRGRVYESGEHKAMKGWVELYLRDLGFQVARGEVSKLGYEIDVGCLEKNIYVECGDTEPRKVFEFLRNGLNMGLLPYNSEHIVWFITSEEFQKYAVNKSFGYM
jgi:hypothetical protein